MESVHVYIMCIQYTFNFSEKTAYYSKFKSDDHSLLYWDLEFGIPAVCEDIIAESIQSVL